MAGSGVTPGTVGAILAAVPLGQIHASCARVSGPPAPRAAALGFGSAPPRRTHADEVRRMKAALGA